MLELKENQGLLSKPIHELYFDLRGCGFIYGSNQAVVNDYILNSDLTKEEYAKINLIISLYAAKGNTSNFDGFVESVIDFYMAINDQKYSFFNDILTRKKSNSFLEKIINKRIQIDANFFTKNFNYFITNALLFVDVLAYIEYLKSGHISKEYTKHLENAIETIVVEVLNSKKYKTKYDQSLIKLLESSLRYQNTDPLNYEEVIQSIKNDLESQYLLDIACMASWSDQKIDAKEELFLKKLGKDITLAKKVLNIFDIDKKYFLDISLIHRVWFDL